VEPVENALQAVNTTLKWIYERYKGAEFKCFLTGKGNYRAEISTIQPYKGDRSEFAKPRHYAAIRQHLIKQYGAVVIDGMEADDEIGIQATEAAEEGKEPIIVTIDKDLDQIPCKHYNWVKQEEYSVTDEEAYRNFFGQLLTGDRVDFVPGIAGVGPVGAGKILANCRGPASMLFEVREAYQEHYPTGYPRLDGSKLSSGDAMLEIGRLVWIKRRRDEELWNFRTIKDS
jgi:hypothetical protein